MAVMPGKITAKIHVDSAGLEKAIKLARTLESALDRIQKKIDRIKQKAK